MKITITTNETFKGTKMKELLHDTLPVEDGYNQQIDHWSKFNKKFKCNFDIIRFRQKESSRFNSNYYDEKSGYFELSGSDKVNEQPATDESYVKKSVKREAFFMHKDLKNGQKEYQFIGIFEVRAYIKSMNKYIFVKVADDLVCEL